MDDNKPFVMLGKNTRGTWVLSWWAPITGGGYKDFDNATAARQAGVTLAIVLGCRLQAFRKSP